MSLNRSSFILQTLDNTDTTFKRKLSKREKKEQKKKEKLQKLNPNADDTENHVAEKLYTGELLHDKQIVRSYSKVISFQNFPRHHSPAPFPIPKR